MFFDFRQIECWIKTRLNVAISKIFGFMGLWCLFLFHRLPQKYENWKYKSWLKNFFVRKYEILAKTWLLIENMKFWQNKFFAQIKDFFGSCRKRYVSRLPFRVLFLLCRVQTWFQQRFRIWNFSVCKKVTHHIFFTLYTWGGWRR